MDASFERRLLWRCRRGMLEIDLLLQEFLNLYYRSLTQDQLNTFCRLLDRTDTELFALLTERDNSTDPAETALLSFIRGSRRDTSVPD